MGIFFKACKGHSSFLSDGAGEGLPRFFLSGLTEDNVLDMILWAVPCCILGSRIYYVLFYLDLYRLPPQTPSAGGPQNSKNSRKRRLGAPQWTGTG